MAFSLALSPRISASASAKPRQDPTTDRKKARQLKQDEGSEADAPSSSSLQSPVSFSLSESEQDAHDLGSSSSESSLNTMIRDFHRQPKATAAAKQASPRVKDKTHRLPAVAKTRGSPAWSPSRRDAKKGMNREDSEADLDSGVSPLPKLTKMPKPKPLRPSLLLQPKRYQHSTETHRTIHTVTDDDLVLRRSRPATLLRSPQRQSAPSSPHHVRQRNPSTPPAVARVHPQLDKSSRDSIKQRLCESPKTVRPNQTPSSPSKHPFDPIRIKSSRNFARGLEHREEPAAPHKPSPHHPHQRNFFRNQDDDESKKENPLNQDIDELITNDIHELNHLIFSAKATSLRPGSAATRRSPRSPHKSLVSTNPFDTDHDQGEFRGATRFRKPKPNEFAHLQSSLSPFRSRSKSPTRSASSPSRKSPSRPASSWQVKSYWEEKEQEEEVQNRPELEEALSFAEELSAMRKKTGKQPDNQSVHHHFKTLAFAARAAASKTFNSASGHQQHDLVEGKTADRIREAAHKIDQTLLLALQPFENARKEQEAEDAKEHAKAFRIPVDGPLSTATKSIVQELDQAFAGLNQKAKEVEEQQAKEDAQRREQQKHVQQQEQEIKEQLTRNLILRDSSDIEAALERLDHAEAQAQAHRKNQTDSSPKSKREAPTRSQPESMVPSLEVQMESLRLRAVEKMQEIDNQWNQNEDRSMSSPSYQPMPVPDDTIEALYTRSLYEAKPGDSPRRPYQQVYHQLAAVDAFEKRSPSDNQTDHDHEHVSDSNADQSFQEVVKNKVLDKLDFAILKLKHSLEIDVKEAQEAEAKRREQEAIEKQKKLDKEAQDAKVKKQQEEAKAARDRVLGVRCLEELEEWREARQVARNPAEILALAATPLETEYERLPSFFDDAKVLERFDQMRAVMEQCTGSSAWYPAPEQMEPQYGYGFDANDSPPSLYEQDSDELVTPRRYYPVFPASRRSMRPALSRRRSGMSPESRPQRETVFAQSPRRRHEPRQSFMRPAGSHSGNRRDSSVGLDRRQSAFLSPRRGSTFIKSPRQPIPPRRRDSHAMLPAMIEHRSAAHRKSVPRQSMQSMHQSPRNSFVEDTWSNQHRYQRPDSSTMNSQSRNTIQQASPKRSVRSSETHGQERGGVTSSLTRRDSQMHPRRSSFLQSSPAGDSSDRAKRHSSPLDLSEFSSAIHDFQSKRRQKANWLRDAPRSAMDDLREN